jgi:hypothetical protein
LEKNAAEVINILRTEWKFEDALAWRFKEGIEEGIDKGLEKAARNALMNGFSVDQIRVITGLDTDTINYLRTSAN